MPTITLPDGSQKTYGASISGAEIAASIGEGLAKAAVGMLVDGAQRDLAELIGTDADVVFLTAKDTAGLDIIRHSATAQVLARAIKTLYPSAKLAIGPTIEHGFYYDIAFSEPLSSDDLPKIEQKMKEVIKSKHKIQN